MKALLVASAIVLLSACSFNNTALPSIKEGMGNNPQLPGPKLEKMPTVSIAKAVGWDENTMPTVPAGFNINAFAKGLDHPRWLYTLPNGDVLVAETNGPANPDAGFSIRGWFAQKLMKKRVQASKVQTELHCLEMQIKMVLQN